MIQDDVYQKDKILFSNDKQFNYLNQLEKLFSQKTLPKVQNYYVNGNVAGKSVASESDGKVNIISYQMKNILLLEMVEQRLTNMMGNQLFGMIGALRIYYQNLTVEQCGKIFVPSRKFHLSVKYGETSLINTVNILRFVQSFSRFY